MKRKAFIFAVVLFSSLFTYLQAENKKNEWIIAVSEFEFTNAKPMYASYSRMVPQMFLTYMDNKAMRLESLTEKKMRALMQASSKKLKLIKERTKLIQEKDNLFFSIEAEKTKNEKIKKIEEQIKAKEIEIEKANIDLKVADNKFYDESSPKNVVLWKGGSELYKYDKMSDLGFILNRDGISAIIRGTLKDASGYLIIKVIFETGLKGVSAHSFTEAGRYSDAESMVSKIALQIFTVIQNTRSIKLFFDVSPQNAKVYIDGNIIEDFSRPVSLHEGEYVVEAVADEYVTSTKTVLLKDKNYYKLKINLRHEDSTVLGFNIKGEPNLFFKTRYYGTSPAQLKLPHQTAVLEFEKNSIHTYALIDEEQVPIGEITQNMIVKLNQKETKKLIERQRKIMYWSLAAFYAVLPAYLIVNGIYSDKKLSFDSGRLAQTKDNFNSIKNLGIANVTLQTMAIVAGINYFVQLVVYLVFSDRAIPREIKAIKQDIPQHDISDIENVDMDVSEHNQEETEKNEDDKNREE